MGLVRCTTLLLLPLAAATVWPADDAPSPATIIRPYESLPGAEGTVERVSWIRPVDLALPIVIDNPFGDVHLRSSGPEAVLDVSAVLQQLGPEGARLDLAAAVEVDEVRITVVRTTKTGVATSPGDRSRADLALLVPEGASVRIRTTSGAVESRGLNAALEVATTSGGIDVRQKTGRLTLRSDSGAIVAVLEPGATSAEEGFETTTGTITVWLRDAADADVTLATSGAITTDFSLDVEHHDHDEPDKRARATVGAGGRPVTLTSRRGDLALRRLLAKSGG